MHRSYQQSGYDCKGFYQKSLKSNIHSYLQSWYDRKESHTDSLKSTNLTSRALSLAYRRAFKRPSIKMDAPLANVRLDPYQIGRRDGVSDGG